MFYNDRARSLWPLNLTVCTVDETFTFLRPHPTKQPSQAITTTPPPDHWRASITDNTPASALISLTRMLFPVAENKCTKRKDTRTCLANLAIQALGKKRIGAVCKRGARKVVVKCAQVTLGCQYQHPRLFHRRSLHFIPSSYNHTISYVGL